MLLTGSRALGTYSCNSDVDIDIICSREIFDNIQRAMYQKKLTPNTSQAFYQLPTEGWDRYFGKEVSQPHFSITPIDVIEDQFKNYNDVAIWIWINAVIVIDPLKQFKSIVENFKGYTDDVLFRKVKYRYLLSLYWLIDGYPHHHKNKEEELFTASLSILNGINEMYRLFFLLDGKPYPYAEKLPIYASSTKLGKKFKAFFDKAINMTLGNGYEDITIWDRLDKVIEILLYEDKSKEARELSEACDNELLSLGINTDWVELGYDNIDELLHGKLGPTP
ncbi:hypothetical protein PV797_11775 [Clostridiaceae bacterium M8S5]|nr:hypothetical protein PV797_11775 [Clostridiaceae bacterium M8S5]